MRPLTLLLRAPARLPALLALAVLVTLLAAPADVVRGPGGDAATLRPVAGTDCRGARSFVREGCSPLQRSGTLSPTTSRAAADRPSVYDDDCISAPPTLPVKSCELALRRGTLHVALLGNSLASQWADALGRIGRDRGWRVTTYLASSCPPSAAAVKHSWSARCTAWGRAVRDRMLRQGVDAVVVTSGSGGYRDAGQAEEGYLSYLRPLTTAGVLVEVLRATPHPTATLDDVPPTCLRAHPRDYLACSGRRTAWVEADPLWSAGQRLRRDRSGLLDLTDLFCTARTCVSAAGGLLLYRDGLHLTRTYAESVRPYLDLRLRAAIRADR